MCYGPVRRPDEAEQVFGENRKNLVTSPHELSKKFDKWMKTVDDEPISGASKAWIYEFMILAYLR